MQFEKGSVDGHSAVFVKKPEDRVEAFEQAITLGGGFDSEHIRVSGQRARATAENNAATHQMVEQGETIGDIERMMVRGYEKPSQ